MNIRPLYDRIVVKRIEEQETTRSGIIIPDSAQEKPQEAEVMAVGPGQRPGDGERVSPPVKNGDRILFWEDSGHHIPGGRPEDMIMRAGAVPGGLAATPETAKQAG